MHANANKKNACAVFLVTCAWLAYGWSLIIWLLSIFYSLSSFLSLLSEQNIGTGTEMIQSMHVGRLSMKTICSVTFGRWRDPWDDCCTGPTKATVWCTRTKFTRWKW